MCGRYFIEEEMYKRIEQLLQEAGIFRTLRTERSFSDRGRSDVFPSDTAPVLVERDMGIEAREMPWGLQHHYTDDDVRSRGGLLINARAESIREKPLFGDAVVNRRCIIPVSGFYEWNSLKEKVVFRSLTHDPLFLAGIYDLNRSRDHFVILTTAANASMVPVHDRMPLLIKPGDVRDWILQPRKTDAFLSAPMPELEVSMDYQQMNLFDLGLGKE